jgi:hypothetical protein
VNAHAASEREKRKQNTDWRYIKSVSPAADVHEGKVTEGYGDGIHNPRAILARAREDAVETLEEGTAAETPAPDDEDRNLRLETLLAARMIRVGCAGRPARSRWCKSTAMKE